MHAILMTAALHLYRIDGIEEYWVQSIRHLQHTLGMFNRVLQQPTVIETNADAVLATSILLIVHTAGTLPSSEPCPTPLAFLIKGALDVIQHTRRRPSSVFHRLYRKPTPVPSAAECRLVQDLVRMVRTTKVEKDISPSPNQIASPSFPIDNSSRPLTGAYGDRLKEADSEKIDAYCLTTIEQISDVLHAADVGHPIAPDKILELALQRSSPHYLVALTARHPKALIIAAHCYGALAISLAHHSAPASPGDPTAARSDRRDFWWLDPLPRFTVLATTKELGSAWDEWMRWPRAAVERLLPGSSAGGIAPENIRVSSDGNTPLVDAAMLYPRQGFDTSAPAPAQWP
jgi:hypothetical protein